VNLNTSSIQQMIKNFAMNLISEGSMISFNNILTTKKDNDELLAEIAQLTSRGMPPDKGSPSSYRDMNISANSAGQFSKRRGMVSSQSSAAGSFSKDACAERLINELLLQKAELETQFSELRESYYALELRLERYKLFYEFAPVGYLSIDLNGNIIKSNYAVKGLVGLKGAQINQLPFARFVVEEDQPLFTAFLEKVFCERAGKKTCELRLSKKGSSTISVLIEAQISGSGLECMVAIIDITRLRPGNQMINGVADNIHAGKY
jgi:PAS domain S-box-containing protein